MRRHGVHFQPSLSGALHTARTNAFFMGGGKALVNAYYRSAARLGVEIRYDAPVDALELRDGEFVAARIGSERIPARSCVVAAGGFESDRAWLREAWGQNERGEWPADNFLIRGTRFNRGVLLKHLIASGADSIGDPSQSHCVAIDARAPLYDGGICTRVDCVSLGIMLNRNAERFYDEGEDFWPKRYAIWGRLVAGQPGQIGYAIIDSKAIGRFMPPVFPGVRGETLDDLARQLGLDEARFMRTVTDYNAACRVGRFDHTVLDDCHTENLTPAKTHWALPLDTPPYYGYALRPGITFTYLGLKVNEQAAVHFGGRPCRNLFVAGEMMAGNVLGKGYLAGIGMSIGTTFGRIAGTQAARAVQETNARERHAGV
jgi:tricarballylate dehydrogenase